MAKNNQQSLSDVIAGALIKAGVKVVTNVPGSGGNEVFAAYRKISRQIPPVSFHEEVAYSLAHGAALAGARAAALFKSHGLVKAGNSVIDSLYAGTTAGLLIIVFSDKSGTHSDSILDIRPYMEGTGLPYEMINPGQPAGQIIRLFQESEKRRLPYALLVEAEDTRRVIEADEEPMRGTPSPEYQRNITQHVLCPFFVEYQYRVLKAKYANEDWASIAQPAIPRIPESLPYHWKEATAAYAGLFSVFKAIRGPLVTGDTGVSSLFACEPYNCIDITTYFGGSVPLAAGAYLAGYPEAWALTGDFAFIAAGHLGLLEARQRGIPLKVIIFYNGKAETTGGQPIPQGTLETVLAGYERYVSYIRNPNDTGEVESVLRRAKMSPEMSIVVADYRQIRGQW